MKNALPYKHLVVSEKLTMEKVAMEWVSLHALPPAAPQPEARALPMLVQHIPRAPKHP